ncbi:hypothetical protein C5167_045297 [Papaver somniferum]|uniref:Uncharacterized protein n=1 Tax=Papaver somniferum TaxID=3469 RepID=A0A4Y7LDZ8_PAPSO|nr:hypothetical protein C5167_045297 [Papaver somniferum]
MFGSRRLAPQITSQLAGCNTVAEIFFTGLFAIQFLKLFPSQICIILDLLQPKSWSAAANSKGLLIRLKFAASIPQALSCVTKIRAKLGGGCHEHNVMLALYVVEDATGVTSIASLNVVSGRKKVEFLELQDLVKGATIVVMETLLLE